jgi:hypothetical protein
METLMILLIRITAGLGFLAIVLGALTMMAPRVQCHKNPQVTATAMSAPTSRS